MIVREHVPLSELTTFTVGGRARYVLELTNVEEMETVYAFIRTHGLPFVVLGQGSNVLPSDDDYEGIVVLMQTKGTSLEEREGSVYVTAAAGESWDELVSFCAAQGLWGIENLAGIPGTVGAAPVQNIGAYGTELVQVFDHARVWNVETEIEEVYTKEQCAFAYRDSHFKHHPNLIILSVTFRLSRTGAPQVGYKDLQVAAAEGADLSTPSSIAATVRTIRSKKFPDIREFGTAGSFFKNPILSSEQFSELAQRYGAVPSFPNPQGIKVPLAYILDRVLALRGYHKGPTFLFGNQPLVLVAERGARAADVEALASEIEHRVFETTGIRIEREVRDLSFHEYKK